MPGRKQTILIDFDGVLHDYRGWKGPTEVGPPINGARKACLLLERNFRLVCFTTRSVEVVKPWLACHGFPVMKVTNVKEPAWLLIDDRAITFNGLWTDEFLATIKAFNPHWKVLTVEPEPDQYSDSSPQEN